MDEDGNTDAEDEGSEEEELDENGNQMKKKEFGANYEKINEIFPTSTIVINGNDKNLTRRVMELSEEEIAGTHYNA